MLAPSHVVAHRSSSAPSWLCRRFKRACTYLSWRRIGLRSCSLARGFARPSCPRRYQHRHTPRVARRLCAAQMYSTARAHVLPDTEVDVGVMRVEARDALRDPCVLQSSQCRLQGSRRSPLTSSAALREQASRTPPGRRALSAHLSSRSDARKERINSSALSPSVRTVHPGNCAACVPDGVNAGITSSALSIGSPFAEALCRLFHLDLTSCAAEEERHGKLAGIHGSPCALRDSWALYTA